MKPLLAVVAGVLAGLGAGAIWTWAQADRYRADARVLVRPASARIVPAVEALAESSLVEANVAQTLRLSSPPDVAARTGDGGVVTVSASADTRERARQIDAEAVVVLTQKVAQRFAPTVGVTTTVVDPAHAAEQTSPTPARNFLLCALGGLALGLVGAFAFRRRTAHSTGEADPLIERRLRARLDQVAKRERALAKRAGELAARERELGRREAEASGALSERESALEERQLDGAHVAADEAAAPAAEAIREPELPVSPEQTAAETAASVGAAATSGWTLAELEGFVRERAAAGEDSGRQEEWSMYLFLLRQHAAADGSLPSAFDQLINDVFAPRAAG